MHVIGGCSEPMASGELANRASVVSSVNRALVANQEQFEGFLVEDGYMNPSRGTTNSDA